jgi:hypothetical protein
MLALVKARDFRRHTVPPLLILLGVLAMLLYPAYVAVILIVRGSLAFPELRPPRRQALVLLAALLLALASALFLDSQLD